MDRNGGSHRTEWWSGMGQNPHLDPQVLAYSMIAALAVHAGRRCGTTSARVTRRRDGCCRRAGLLWTRLPAHRVRIRWRTAGIRRNGVSANPGPVHAAPPRKVGLGQLTILGLLHAGHLLSASLVASKSSGFNDLCGLIRFNRCLDQNNSSEFGHVLTSPFVSFVYGDKPIFSAQVRNALLHSPHLSRAVIFGKLVPFLRHRRRT